LVHNFYRSANPSGENQVVERDMRDLRAAGIDVLGYFRESDEIEGFSRLSKALLATRPLVSPGDLRSFARLIRYERPDIVHIHNTYPLISPQVIRAANAAGIPVVHTVHNFRHTCVNGLFFRDGVECRLCEDRFIGWPAIKHGCYRESRGASASMVASLAVHRPTWRRVDRFLPVSETVAKNLISVGVDPRRITVRPNVIPDPGEPKALGHGALFVGRLAEEKGIRQLLSGWAQSGVGTRGYTLTIAGDGPMRSYVEKAAEADASVSYVGLVPAAEVPSLIDSAALMIVPSIWAEADPLAAISGLAAGRPVAGATTGALAAYLDDSCGWLFEPSDQAIAEMLTVALPNRDEMIRRGHGARRRYLDRRSPAASLPLTRIYGDVLAAGVTISAQTDASESPRHTGF
jgi:glycosyltransferase involved in cell wall biosynthesis